MKLFASFRFFPTCGSSSGSGSATRTSAGARTFVPLQAVGVADAAVGTVIRLCSRRRGRQRNLQGCFQVSPHEERVVPGFDWIGLGWVVKYEVIG